jgi:UDP-N-acetylmuramoylalanine--D-glutamate ligase
VSVEKVKVIVGLGKTGYACARYFMRHGISFSVADDSLSPAYLSRLRADIPLIEVLPIDADAFVDADQIILSPGVPLSNESIQMAVKSGLSVTGDIAIFAQETKKEFVAITGTNGKSTVTQLLAEMAVASEKSVGVGGNIGTPCLELLEREVDLNILEVSSYQLEVVDFLGANVAVLLNLAPDHLDRYQSNETYYQTKLKIFRDCKIAVIPRALKLELNLKQVVYSFGLDEAETDYELGINVVDGTSYFSIGKRALLSTDALGMKGRHNWLNALAGLAAAYALGLSEDGMIRALCSFKGLPHRCQSIGEFRHIQFINDSKSTNPSSTIAAIEGLSGTSTALVLILGGVAKGADIGQLRDVIDRHVSTCLIYGQDRELIKVMLGNDVADITLFESLGLLVDHLRNKTRGGDLVLFSPACASFDQFDNFEHRGEVFTQLIERYFS